MYAAAGKTIVGGKRDRRESLGNFNSPFWDCKLETRLSWTPHTYNRPNSAHCFIILMNVLCKSPFNTIMNPWNYVLFNLNCIPFFSLFLPPVLVSVCHFSCFASFSCSGRNAEAIPLRFGYSQCSGTPADPYRQAITRETLIISSHLNSQKAASVTKGNLINLRWF